jgi:hypothetical protein
MQVNILPPAHPGVLTMMSFQNVGTEAREWVNRQLQSSAAVLTDAGRQFLNTATELHRVYNDGTLDRMARKLTRSVKSILHPNTIVPLDTISAVQSAQPIMQRYIMAQPDIRELYFKQLCDGYSDSYSNYWGSDIREEHYDYRRVMDGIVEVVKVEGEEEEMLKVSYYFEDLIAGDRHLDLDEKFTILSAWDVVRNALDSKTDPTDIFNGCIGG